MSKILVLDSKYQRLNPVNPSRARMLLDQGKAAITRQYPLTIILNPVDNCRKKYFRIKREPGAKKLKLSNNAGLITGINPKYCNQFYRKNDYRYG
jgi:RRXRR protein